MTTVETTDLTREQAEEITHRIQTNLEETWDNIGQAYRGRAWVAMEYRTWDTYCQEEFGTGRIKIPLEEREEVITRLQREEMSGRAIAAATGMGETSVRRAKAAAPDGAPATVTGLDGKTYPARREAVGCFNCGGTITGPVFYNDGRPYCNDCDTLINPDPVIVADANPVDGVEKRIAKVRRAVEKFAKHNPESADWDALLTMIRDVRRLRNGPV